MTLAGFHAVNNSMFELAKGFAATGMGAYSELQQREFANEKLGYTATKHQREVGRGPDTCMSCVPACSHCMSCSGAVVADCTSCCHMCPRVQGFQKALALLCCMNLRLLCP